jgi:hypothetical protein
VADALRIGSAKKVREAFSATVDARRYNPFHRLYADRDAAFVTWFDGSIVHQQELSHGLTVVTERSLGGDDVGREERVRRQLEPFLGPMRTSRARRPRADHARPRRRRPIGLDMCPRPRARIRHALFVAARDFGRP